MVAPLPNVTTWDKDSASREQNKINQFVFYDEAKPILSKFKQLYDMSICRIFCQTNSLFKKKPAIEVFINDGQ